jgi:TetR/AcrR family transcriptional repressor of bet genes
MARPSVREQRRAELTSAFARVLADHGYAGATIAAVADEAGVAPGLVHHHFADKRDLLDSLLSMLAQRFRERTRGREPGRDPLAAYIAAAVALDGDEDLEAARCWVGVLAEAVRDPATFARLRRMLDGELMHIERRGEGQLDAHDSAALLAFILGSLVLGTFAPERCAGFAEPAITRFVDGLERT